MTVIRLPRIPRSVTVLTFVIALLVAAPAFASAPPGQRLVNYIAAHEPALAAEASVRVRLDGGHTAVVNGQPVARDVTAIVLTTAPDTHIGGLVAQRLCAAASVGIRVLHLKMISSIEVRARDGRPRATSFAIGFHSCHLVP